MSETAISTDLIRTVAHLVIHPAYSRISVPMWDNGELLMTDGRIAIAIRCDEPPQDMEHIAKVDGRWNLGEQRMSPPDIAGLLNKIPMLPSVKCPVVEGPEQDWDSHWQVMTECDTCGGDGEAECDMGHTHDCTTCDGEGSYLQAVEAATDGVHIGNAIFARRIVWIMNYLPDLLLNEPQVDAPTGFVFSGGRGAVMPLKQDKD